MTKSARQISAGPAQWLACCLLMNSNKRNFKGRPLRADTPARALYAAPFPANKLRRRSGLMIAAAFDDWAQWWTSRQPRPGRGDGSSIRTRLPSPLLEPNLSRIHERSRRWREEDGATTPRTGSAGGAYSAGCAAGEPATTGVPSGRRICSVLMTLRDMNDGSGGPLARASSIAPAPFRTSGPAAAKSLW